MSPEEYAEYTELVDSIIEAALTATQTVQECQVALMHLCGLNDSQIAAALEVTRQRVQQIRAAALEHMAEYLRGEGYTVGVGNFSFRSGRTRRKNVGERNGQARLTEALVREIRAQAAQGTTCTELARRYAIPRTTLQSVVSGQSWRHVR